MRGRFITLEGGEGTGKSTQSTLLSNRLRNFLIKVVQTREPGGSTGAEVIRHVILSGAAKPFGPETEAILFAAARADHIQNTIAPALAEGVWVVCDRYIDSTRAYQGALGNVDLRLIQALERHTVGDALPDLTFILDIDAREGLARATARRGDDAADRFEGEALDFHVRLRNAYRKIAAESPQRCILIDAGGTKDEVARAIWDEVDRRFDPATAPAAFEDV
jgi:dTMP kinase